MGAIMGFLVFGPMTGRGAGYCNGLAVLGFENSAQFTGGFGCGFGRGFRRTFYATGVPGWARYGYPTGTNTAAFDEKTYLSNQAESPESQLQQVKKRLSSLNEETK